MPDDEQTPQPDDRDPYEPPAVIALGYVADLTLDDGGSPAYSDARLKDEIRPLDGALERLRSLRTR